MSMTRRRLLDNTFKKTVTGNPVIATDSLARMYPGIEMQGWTEQDSTTGANLFDKSTVIKNKYINDSTGEMHDKAEGDTSASDYVLVRGLSYIRVTTTTFAQWMAFYDINKDFISGINGYGEPIQVPQNAEYARFTIPNPVVDTFMVNAGSELLPWEPYTGGAPSPSPDYPQEIVSAGNYDEAIGKYEYGVEICGKNLFNPNGEHVSGLYLGFPINNKDTVSIAIYEKNSNIDVSGIFFGFTGNGINAEDGAHWVLSNGNVMSDGKTYYEPQNGYVSIYPPNKLETFLERYDVMLNDGRAVYPAYEPYKPPQTVTLTSDRPLTKWDKLTKKDGVWGWVYKSKEYVLNGNERCDDTWVPSMVLYIDDTDNYVVHNESFYCNNFETVSASNTKGSGFSIKVANYVNLQTAESFKAFLAEKAQKGTPVIIWAETKKETFVPLSETEQEQMNNLYTYRPTTVLSNQQDCQMALTYKTRKGMS